MEGESKTKRGVQSASSPIRDTDPEAYMELMRNYQRLETISEKQKGQLREAKDALAAAEGELSALKYEFHKWQTDHGKVHAKAAVAATGASRSDRPISAAKAGGAWRPGVDELTLYVGRLTAKEFMSQLATVEADDGDPEAHVALLYDLLHRVIVKARATQERTTLLEDDLVAVKEKILRLQKGREAAEAQKLDVMDQFAWKDGVAKKLAIQNEILIQDVETALGRSFEIVNGVFAMCETMKCLPPSRSATRDTADKITRALRQLTQDVKGLAADSRTNGSVESSEQTAKEILFRLDAALAQQGTERPSWPSARDLGPPLAPILCSTLQAVCYCTCVLVGAKSSASNPITPPLLRKTLTPRDKEALIEWSHEARTLLATWRVVQTWFNGVPLTEDPFLNMVDAFLRPVTAPPVPRAPHVLAPVKSKLELNFDRLFQAVVHPAAPDALRAVNVTISRMAAHSHETAKMNWKGLHCLHRLEGMKNTVAMALAGHPVDHLLKMYVDRVSAERDAWAVRRSKFQVTRHALWCDFLAALRAAEDGVMRSGINLRSIQMTSGSVANVALLAHKRILSKIKETDGAQQAISQSMAQPRTSRWEDRQFVVAARDKFLDAKFGAIKGLRTSERPQSSLGGLQLQAAMKRLSSRQRQSSSYLPGK